MRRHFRRHKRDGVSWNHDAENFESLPTLTAHLTCSTHAQRAVEALTAWVSTVDVLIARSPRGRHAHRVLTALLSRGSGGDRAGEAVDGDADATDGAGPAAQLCRDDGRNHVERRLLADPRDGELYQAMRRAGKSATNHDATRIDQRQQRQQRIAQRVARALDDGQGTGVAIFVGAEQVARRSLAAGRTPGAAQRRRADNRL